MKSSAASGSSAAAASALDCSIVMIAHNRARQLPASLAALARQAARAPRFELILVNDGSTDGTGRLARAYRAPFPYRYLERENTNCRAAARNLALQHARGKVILFLDAECIAPAGLVASHVQRHARGCQAIAGGIRVLAEPVSPALVARDPALLRLLPQLQKPYLPLPERGRAPGFITAHASCRREDAFRIGFFDESFTGYGGEDLDFGERLALAGVEVTAAGGLVVFHQPHPIVADHGAGVAAALRRLRRKHSHAWRILHVLDPPGDPSLAQAVRHSLHSPALKQYRMEAVATGAAAAALRGRGIHPVPPEAADARARNADLVHVHTAPGDEGAPWRVPGPRPIHGVPTVACTQRRRLGSGGSGGRASSALHQSNTTSGGDTGLASSARRESSDMRGGDRGRASSALSERGDGREDSKRAEPVCIYTCHSLEVAAAHDGAAPPLPLSLKLQYDTLLCGARYSGVMEPGSSATPPRPADRHAGAQREAARQPRAYATAPRVPLATATHRD